MKKLLFLFFTLCSLLANGQLMFYHSTAGGQGTETTLPLEELTEIPFHQVLWNGDTSIHNVARVDSLYQGVIGVPANYYVEWDIIEALPNTGQGDTLASGTGNYITYVFGPEHTNRSYDISLRAWWDFNAGKQRYIRRAIRNVGIPILTGSEPGVTHMNISSASGFWTSPPATDTVLLYGHRTSGNFIIQNWPGVYIQVEAGTELNASFVIGDGCTGVTIDACTDNSVQYGFLIHRGLGTGDAFVVDPDRLATYTTTDSITVSGIEARESTVGFHLEGADVAGNGSPPASPKLSGYRIFNCLAYETDTEGFYLGWTRDYEGFAQMVGAVYHHLIAYYTGWDGMQPGNTDGCEIHDLQVWFAGQQDNSNQFSDFSINGVANGWFYNLNMQGGHKGFTGSTGQYGGNIHIFRTYIEGGTHNESLQYSWYRLGDGAFDDRTVDFLMYNSFFHNNYNGPFGFYTNGADGADSLNFQFDDNVVTGTHGYSAPSSSYLIDLSYEKSWLADYDTLGYGADLTSGGFPDGPPGGLTIESIVALDGIEDDYGTAIGSLGLPSSCTINLSNATTDVADIDWDEGSYDETWTGIQTVTGTLINLPSGVTNPGNVQATIQVTINTVAYGTIHSDDFNGDLSKYTVTAPTSTISIVSSNLRLTAGDGDFANYIQLTDAANVFNVHMLEKWRIRATFIAPTPTSGTFGFGVGVRSVGSHSDMDNIVRIDFSTGSSGTYVGTYFFYTAVNHSGSPNQDFLNNDPDYIVGGTTYVLEVIRNKNVITANTYASDGTTLLYTRSKTYNITTASAVNLHNAGRFCIWNFGGTIDITNLVIDTETQVGADVVGLGDSNMHGMYAETNARRYVEQACDNLDLTFEIIAGVDAGSVDGQAVVPAIIALDPKVCYVNIVQNDEANGVADATYQSNLADIVSDLETAGITVIVGIPSARDGVDVSGIRTHVNATYTSNERVDLFGATKNVGNNNLQNSLEVGDNIHLDEDGNDTCTSPTQTAITNSIP